MMNTVRDLVHRGVLIRAAAPVADTPAILMLIADIRAPTPADVSNAGIAFDTFIVPEGVSTMRLQIDPPQPRIVFGSADPNLVLGTVGVFDETSSGNIPVGGDGNYPVTPGHALVIAVRLSNLYSSDTPPAAALASDWVVPYRRSFVPAP